MSTLTTPHNLIKTVGGDNWRSALKTDLPANMEIINAGLSRNLLTNPGFEVFQRGGTITADLAYAHDRWQLDLAGSSTCTITDETTTVDTGSGHALKAVYVHNTASIVDQKIEDYLQLRGRTITFAVRVRKGVASSAYPYISDSGSKTYGATTATTGAYETLSVTLAIGASATSVRAGVELRISDTVYLDSATLHVGSAAVAYTPLPPAEDLARCQRYYEVLFGATDQGFRGYQLIGAPIYQMVGYRATKAVTPTVTKNGTWAVSNCGQPSAVAATGKDQIMLGITATATGELYALVNSADDTFTSEANV
jgi:hypothetical protein